jgi:hypothetical protein
MSLSYPPVRRHMNAEKLGARTSKPRGKTNMLRHACLVIAVGCGLFAAASGADALTVNTLEPYRFLTTTAVNNYWTTGCNAATCSTLSDSGGNAYTSDWGVGLRITVSGASDGDTISMDLVKPDGTKVPCPAATYHDPCPVQGAYNTCWTSISFGTYWVPAGYGDFLDTQQTTCQSIGNWSVEFNVDSTLYSSTPFTMGHDSPYLGISSPSSNQANLSGQVLDIPLFQLLQGNYNSTGTVPFVAQTNTGNSITWQAGLQYQTSSGNANISDSRGPFSTNSNEEHDEAFAKEGGQLNITASTTASDGSTITDCVTAYVEGPETGSGAGNGGLTGGSGIPNSGITATLNSLYPASYSYNLYFSNDNTATPSLMTGIACRESGYHHFLTPAEGNSDLFNSLYNNQDIPAKWPNENFANSNTPRGVYLGLMQVQASSDQQTDPNAWDWTTNAMDAVTKFSGGSRKVSDDVQDVVRWEGYLINGDGTTVQSHVNSDGSTFAPLDAFQRENNALMEYGGYLSEHCPNLPLSCVVNYLYYTPQCPSPGTYTCTNKKCTCSGADWQWVSNSTNESDGLNYVQNGANGVRDPLLPQCQ